MGAGGRTSCRGNLTCKPATISGRACRFSAALLRAPGPLHCWRLTGPKSPLTHLRDPSLQAASAKSRLTAWTWGRSSSAPELPGGDWCRFLPAGPCKIEPWFCRRRALGNFRKRDLWRNPAIGRCRSVRLAGPSDSTARRSTTHPAAPIRLPWRSGSGRYVKPVFGMATDAFTSRWTAKAGASTSRNPIGRQPPPGPGVGIQYLAYSPQKQRKNPAAAIRRERSQAQVAEWNGSESQPSLMDLSYPPHFARDGRSGSPQRRGASTVRCAIEPARPAKAFMNIAKISAPATTRKPVPSRR